MVIFHYNFRWYHFFKPGEQLTRFIFYRCVNLLVQYIYFQNSVYMIPVKSYAAHNSSSPLVPFDFERRELRLHDVLIEILFSGVCHSDLHQVRDEWGGSVYPMVPGHEIAGKVIATGDHVTKFKVGDIAGVGVMIDSCRTCKPCTQRMEQYCEEGMTGTYNGSKEIK
jgi:alcohol dehydrogenase (NADP+)